MGWMDDPERPVDLAAQPPITDDVDPGTLPEPRPERTVADHAEAARLLLSDGLTAAARAEMNKGLAKAETAEDVQTLLDAGCEYDLCLVSKRARRRLDWPTGRRVRDLHRYYEF